MPATVSAQSARQACLQTLWCPSMAGAESAWTPAGGAQQAALQALQRPLQEEEEGAAAAAARAARCPPGQQLAEQRHLRLMPGLTCT